MNCILGLNTVYLEPEYCQTLFLELHSVLMADCWLWQRNDRISSLSTLVCHGTHSRYICYGLSWYYMLQVLIHVEADATVRVHLNHY